METAKLHRFLIGFKTEVLPKCNQDNTGLVYLISQSLAEDPLVSEIANIQESSGHSTGEFMGVKVQTVKDFGVSDYRL